MANPGFEGEVRPWLVIVSEPMALILQTNEGRTRAWPGGDVDYNSRQLKQARDENNAMTMENGVTLVWDFMDTPEKPARLINHEHEHYKLYQDPSWAKRTWFDREEEILRRDLRSLNSITPEKMSATVYKEMLGLDKALTAKKKWVQTERKKYLKRLTSWLSKSWHTSALISRIKSTEETQIGTTAGDFSVSPGALKKVMDDARLLQNRLDTEEAHRRLAEQEAQRREEQARVERDDFQFAIYWIFNECRGTPSLPIQGNFARLLATRPDAGKTLRRLASFQYTKAENAALSECVELLIRSLPDYPNAERIEIDRNWARRVQREELERRTYHPPAKQTPSATPLMKPSPRIPFPSQPRSPAPQPSPSPAQPAPEPERPYMKPCINGRCLNLD